MRFRPRAILLFGLLAAAFGAGYWSHPSHAGASAHARQVLYYHDPMHPSYKSDKPGIAPDCGMQLEPVYAGGSPEPADTVGEKPGTVRINANQQQLIGLRTVKAARSSGWHTVHLIGKVAADETRVNRVSAALEGVIREASPYTEGMVVRKDDLLAKYFVTSRDVYNALQSYFVTLNNLDQGLAQRNDASIVKANKAQVELSEELLRSYGLTNAQLQELAHSREITRAIEFRSPVAGIILSRNAAPGQRVDKGAELFRVADLSRVWVLASAFENESALCKPGARARVIYGGRIYLSQIEEARQFDPVSRTLNIRLTVDNPDFSLRPGMFVNVEFSVRDGEGITVPIDSVLDSGTRKTVFVSTGNGALEPREVATGAQYGDRVQVLKGLSDGEDVAVSGLFLLSSESRLMLASSKAAKPAHPEANAGSDPVCGMSIDLASAEHSSVYAGAKYHFCSKDCKEKFDKQPSRYAPPTT